MESSLRESAMRPGGTASFMIMLVVLLAWLPFGVAWADSIDPSAKFAWAENVGWVNFRPTNAGAAVFSDHMEGYVWAENIGYVKLGSHSGGGAHTYQNTDTTNWGVNRSGTILSGYGWSENAGWINFAPDYGGITIDPVTRKFDGYAWGENIGWIHLRNANPAYGLYGVALALPYLVPIYQLLVFE